MSKKAKTKHERTVFEWAILGVSLAAIVAIVGGLAIYSLTFGGGPPDLRTDLRSEGGGEFTLTVVNEGATTAIDVLVEVSRGEEPQIIEFRAIPKGHEDEASVTLGGSGEPKANVVAFKEP